MLGVIRLCVGCSGQSRVTLLSQGCSVGVAALLSCSFQSLCGVVPLF